MLDIRRSAGLGLMSMSASRHPLLEIEPPRDRGTWAVVHEHHPDVGEYRTDANLKIPTADIWNTFTTRRFSRAQVYLCA